MAKDRTQSQAQTVFAISSPTFDDGLLIVKFFIVGRQHPKPFGFLLRDFPRLVTQIENALASDELFFTPPDGARYAISENLLRELKIIFTQYRGGTDAEIVACGGEPQTKASADGGESSAPRNFDPAATGCAMNNGDGVADAPNPKSCGGECLEPPQDASFKNSTQNKNGPHNPGQGSQTVPSRGSATPRGATFPRVKTRNGRTSVVVATRKVS